MNKRQKETLSVRITSVGFTCLAFAVFKPLGLGQLGLMLYVHLMAIWVLGVGVCFLTETIMKLVVRMPATLSKGADYIIRRNLWFQLINTPLEALLICLYLHFPMTSIGAESPLSWLGCVQTIFLVAFCSFAIGLYWRYKFRSRYLSDELEEIKALNEQLKHSPKTAISQPAIVLTGTTNETITLQVHDLLYIEAVGNYVKVCRLHDGAVRSDMLRATSKQMEEELHDYPMVVRCHRAFLVNLNQVDQVICKSGSMQLSLKQCTEHIPVSRSKIPLIKKAILTR